ncbi:MAG TPA: FtsX-like permease family protein [Trebonia sp.]
MLTVTLAGLRARWSRMLLSAVAVALGVAFTAATLIYTGTVNASYYAQFAAQAKNIDAVIEPRAGALLPLSGLTAARAVPGVVAAEGRMQGALPIVGAGGRAYAGIAVDLPADPRFRSYTVLSGGGDVLLDQDTAALDHVAPGAPVTVIDTGGHEHRLVVTGIVDADSVPDPYGGSVLILPAATVRALTGADGYQRIDVAAAPGVGQSALAARLSALSAPGLRQAGATAKTGGELATQLAEQSAGGQGLLSTGLLIFSLVSLVVASLVIYNSFRILLAQRLKETALLRCVGATRRQIIASIIAESVATGLAASVAGTIVAAILVAALNSGRVSLTPRSVLLSLAIGTAVTVGAALFPAIAASRTAPVAALATPHEGTVRRKAGRIVGALLLGGIGLALTAVGIPAAKDGLVVIAAGGTIFFLGFLLIGPLVAGPLATALGWLPSRLLGVQMRLATTGARRNPARTATTTVALTIGIGLMTLFCVVLSTANQLTSTELNRHYPADYLLSASNAGIPASVAAGLRSSSRIAEAAAIRENTVAVNGRPEPVIAIEPSAYRSVFMPDVGAGSLSAVATGSGGIAINGAEAQVLHVSVGGSVRLAGRSFRVDALFSGSVLNETAVISWADFSRIFGPGGDSAVLVKARAGVSLASSAAAVDAAVARYPLINVTSAASQRAHMTASVHKLSDLLDGLVAVSIAIALVGMANTLSLSILERTRESALLRAIGLTRRQLRRMIGMEAVLIALMGTVAGVAFGVGFGWAISRGFTRTQDVAVSYPVLQITAYAVLAAVAALLASVIPARRAARLSVIEGLAAE